jgi:hypothetical protein
VGPNSDPSDALRSSGRFDLAYDSKAVAASFESSGSVYAFDFSSSSSFCLLAFRIIYHFSLLATIRLRTKIERYLVIDVCDVHNKFEFVPKVVPHNPPNDIR